MLTAIALVLSMAASPAAPAEPALLLVARRLVELPDCAVRENVMIRIERGRIMEVAAATRASKHKHARVIDLGDLTLLPGLIDTHVHLTLGGDAEKNALATLRAGFTTVQDLGALDSANLVLRDRIASGAIMGPRIVSAGPWLGIRGGTCDFRGIGVRGPEAFRRRVRDDVARGADVIKVCVDGWPQRAFLHPDSVEISPPELAAAVMEAGTAHRPVIVHATGRAGVRLAVDSGVRAIAHANFADSLTAAAMIERRVFVIPTLASLVGQQKGPWVEALLDHMRGLFARGVSISFGTDAGVIAHGDNATEFAWMVRLGMTPADAIRAATVNAAALLGRSRELGRLAPGYAADVIAVEGNPLEDIEALSRVVLVVKGGAVVRDDSGADRHK